VRVRLELNHDVFVLLAFGQLSPFESVPADVLVEGIGDDLRRLADEIDARYELRLFAIKRSP